MTVYCVKSFAHVECYKIVCAGHCIWLKAFTIVLFVICSAVVVECCVLYPCCDVLGMLLVIWVCRRYTCLCLDFE